MGTRIGWGSFTLERFGPDEFVVTVTGSPFAEAYGAATAPVCHLTRGVLEAAGEGRAHRPPTRHRERRASATGAVACRFEARRDVTATTMWQPDREALEREALDRLVLERMRATLARARTNPAWARRLGDAHPDDLKRVDDWQRLPFLTKDELRDAYPFGLACGAMRRLSSRVHMSSGTTGNPILNPYTAERRRAVGRGDGALLRRGRRHACTTSSRSRRRSGSSRAASASTTAPSGSARW